MAEHLDEEQRQEITEAFDLHDKSKQGRVGLLELQKIMRYLGHNLSIPECKDIITEAGGVGEFIDKDTFLRWMGKKYQQIDTVDELIMAFQVFDRDGKGMITSVELRHILTNLGDRMLDEEAEAIVNQADPHGGGSINYAQFVQLMSQAMK